MTTRQQRTALAQCAPDLPTELPPRKRGKEPPLTVVIAPYVEKRFSTDADWRKSVSSINAENSPNGRTCFDDKDAAVVIKQDGQDDGVRRIIEASVAAMSTAVKRVLTKHGVGRNQRIAEAKQIMRLGAQPAE